MCCLNSETGSVTTERCTEKVEGLRAAWRQDEHVLWSPGLSQEQALWFWYSRPSTHWEQVVKTKAKIRHRPTLHFFYWSKVEGLNSCAPVGAVLPFSVKPPSPSPELWHENCFALPFKGEHNSSIPSQPLPPPAVASWSSDFSWSCQQRQTRS